MINIKKYVKKLTGILKIESDRKLYGESYTIDKTDRYYVTINSSNKPRAGTLPPPVSLNTSSPPSTGFPMFPKATSHPKTMWRRYDLLMLALASNVVILDPSKYLKQANRTDKDIESKLREINLISGNTGPVDSFESGKSIRIQLFSGLLSMMVSRDMDYEWQTSTSSGPGSSPAQLDNCLLLGESIRVQFDLIPDTEFLLCSVKIPITTDPRLIHKAFIVHMYSDIRKDFLGALNENFKNAVHHIKQFISTDQKPVEPEVIEVKTIKNFTASDFSLFGADNKLKYDWTDNDEAE